MSKKELIDTMEEENEIDYEDRLKNIEKMYNEIIEKYNENDNGEEPPIEICLIYKIKFLLNLIEELKKENKELKSGKAIMSPYYIFENYIPKQKIVDTIDKHIRGISQETCWEGNTSQQLTKRQNDLTWLKEELLGE